MATTLGQSGSSYAAVAPQVLCFLQSFWVASGGYVDSNSRLPLYCRSVAVTHNPV